MANVDAIGQECWAGRNTGNQTTPVWSPALRLKDVSVPLSKEMASVDRRQSKFKLYRGALIDAGLEFGYVYTSGTDAHFDALVDSFFNDTAVNFAVLNDDIVTSGAEGLRFWGIVSDMPDDQSLAEGRMFNFTLKNSDYEEPAGTLIEPTWHETA